MEQTEAAADLQAVQLTMDRTRQAIAHSGAGYYMIIWGIDWLVGFSGSQFLQPETTGLVWTAAHVVAAVACLVASLAFRNTKTERAGQRPRLGLFWGALFAYCIVWMWLLRPQTESEATLFIATIAMFGYVVMGLWLSSRLFAAVGIAVTVLAVAAHLLVPAHFSLVMALLGGGTLIGSGTYVTRCWR